MSKLDWARARGRDRLRDAEPLSSSAFTVFVNRRSGMAHRRRDCETLVQVPDGALRVQEVANNLPRFRYCSRCSPVS